MRKFFSGLLKRAFSSSSSSTSSPFRSEDYWEQRYRSGGNSGPGSYNELAEFKAKILNSFVIERQIESVIEFGSGDGNQLRLANYPRYLGIDVSFSAIRACQTIFSDDATKSFLTLKEYGGQKADLALSIDVLYHLVEDTVFEEYMGRLFLAGRKFVILYSTDFEEPQKTSHVRHRRFTDWVKQNIPGATLEAKIQNEHPDQGDIRSGSMCEFFVYSLEESGIITRG